MIDCSPLLIAATVALVFRRELVAWVKGIVAEVTETN